jgi:spore coat protein YsxE
MAAVQQSYMLYGKQLVPLYLSRQGLPFVSHGRYYYLMPWISLGERKEKHEQIRSFFRTLADLHQTSLKQIDVREEVISAYYEQKKKEWEQQRSFLQSYIEKCENTWYMSPFQLQCCAYFHETMQAYWFAETELEKWYEKIRKQKNGESLGFTEKHGFLIILKRERNSAIFLAGNGPTGTPRFSISPWRFAIICVRFRQSVMNGWKE